MPATTTAAVDQQQPIHDIKPTTLSLTNHESADDNDADPDAHTYLYFPDEDGAICFDRHGAPQHAIHVGYQRLPWIMGINAGNPGDKVYPNDDMLYNHKITAQWWYINP
jgi:hypothetical protein